MNNPSPETNTACSNHFSSNPVETPSALKTLLGISLALFLLAAQSVQAAPLGCSLDAFLFQLQPTDIFRVNLVTGDSFEAASDIAPSERNLNGFGYNDTDGCIWGANRPSAGGNSDRVSRICDDTYTRTDFAIPSLDGRFNVGDVSSDGLLYLYQGGRTVVEVVDVNPGSPTYLTLVDSQNVVESDIADWAFNPIDGQLYALSNGRNGATVVLYRFNPATGARTNLGTASGANIQNGDPLFGAAYFDAAGTFYASENNTGRIYRLLNVATGNTTAEFFSQGPVSSNNDGARCTAAQLVLDYGDAPDSYGTLLASDGARHLLLEPTNNPLRLGVGVWFEGDANAPLDGTGDTQDDSVSFFPFVDPLSAYSLDVAAVNFSGIDAMAYGWIDFDQNGTFEADEAASVAVPDGTAGSVTLAWNSIPADNVAGPTYLRLRITSDPAITTASPTGPAADGEVEDHRIEIGPLPAIGASKQLAQLSDNGDGTWTATFSIGVTNLGNESLEAVQISEDLSDFPAGTIVDEVVSATLELNPAYAPGVDNNLLAGSDDLAQGETNYVTLIVTFTPDGNQPYDNQAVATGVGVISGETRDDLSDNGVQADADGDGNANEAGENDPTPTDPEITPVIGLAKQLAGLADNGNGTWTATFSLVVANLGNEPLENVQISDDLSDLPAGTTVDSLSSTTLAVNAGYAPGADNTLLAGTDSLAIGESRTLSLVITFTPDINQPYINQATASADGIQSGDPTSDLSDNGAEADEDGDGNPNENGENDPTPISPQITPVIGTTKALTSLVDNGNGTWTATYSLGVTNLGNEPLESVQITEDLADFPAGTVVNDVSSAALTDNGAYSPGSDNNLLTGTDQLAIGETKTVTLTITFTPDGTQPYANRALGVGIGAQSSQPTSDPSNNGTAPDPDGDGNPDEVDENSPTPTSPQITPVIGAAKQLSNLMTNNDGTWTAVFTIGVTNLGNEPLENVQINENLAGLPPGTTVDSLSSAMLSVNGSYEPGVDDNLLEGTDGLAIGETKTLTLSIILTPDGNQPYINQAIGSGIGEQTGQETSDPTDNGVDPDADDDSEPNEPGENDPTPIQPMITPVIGAAKELSTLVDNGNGSWTATFLIAVTNLGEEPLASVQISDDLSDFPAGTVVDSVSSTDLTVNGSYAPGVDNDLLDGTDVLAIDATKTVTLVVVFTPDGNQPYNNQAIGSGVGEQSGKPTSDPSDNGTEADTDGDGNPNEDGENDPTPVDPRVAPVDMPVIGAAKELSTLVDNGNGTWTATYAIAVTNLGEEPLEDVQISDDLSDFPAGTVVDDVSSSDLATNGSYEPGVDNDLLAGTDDLAIDATKTVTLVVTFTPDGNQPYNNQAIGSGVGEQSGQPTSDPSDNGTEADTDGDGNPNEDGENDPTPVNPMTTPVDMPVIGAAKQLTELIDNGNGRWTATFLIAVSNLGSEALDSVQITEDLTDFPAGTTVDSLTSATLTVNGSYSPGVDNNLLDGSDVLAVDETKAVMLVITFALDGSLPYSNQAVGSGVGVNSSQPTSDPSDDGTDPDDDGNSNPDELGNNDPTMVNPLAPLEIPALGLTASLFLSLLLVAGGFFMLRGPGIPWPVPRYRIGGRSRAGRASATSRR